MDFDYVVVPALILLIGVLVIWLSMRRILTLARRYSRRWRRAVERIVLTLVILFVAAIAGSASYNSIALVWFRVHNPPPGDIYLVNGHEMHMVCTGSGSPTIVLDAGLGNDTLIWGGVQPVLALTTRVCAYDRAGFGLSEALPAPRDADHIAGELHELLTQAKVTGPIVLMGHSIAGIYVRDFATRYPAEIAGIVFLDGSSPLQDENPAMKAMSATGPPQWVSDLLAEDCGRVSSPRIPTAGGRLLSRTYRRDCCRDRQLSPIRRGDRPYRSLRRASDSDLLAGPGQEPAQTESCSTVGGDGKRLEPDAG